MNILKLLKEKDALLSGHFLLSSGLHSDKYIQCAKVLQYPDIAQKIAKLLVARYSSLAAHPKVDVVVSPALGGIIVGHEIARQLNCRAIFCERENSIMKLRRGFEIKKNEKCLIVEDVVTTGAATKEVAGVIKKANGAVVGKISIVDRTQLEGFVVSLLKVKINTYKPDKCPLCKKNIAVVKPGSKPR